MLSLEFLSISNKQCLNKNGVEKSFKVSQNMKPINWAILISLERRGNFLKRNKLSPFIYKVPKSTNLRRNSFASSRALDTKVKSPAKSVCISDFRVSATSVSFMVILSLSLVANHYTDDEQKWSQCVCLSDYSQDFKEFCMTGTIAYW